MRTSILEVNLIKNEGQDTLIYLLKDNWRIKFVTPLLNCTNQGGTYTQSLVYVLEKEN